MYCVFIFRLTSPDEINKITMYVNNICRSYCCEQLFCLEWFLCVYSARAKALTHMTPAIMHPSITCSNETTPETAFFSCAELIIVVSIYIMLWMDRVGRWRMCILSLRSNGYIFLRCTLVCVLLSLYLWCVLCSFFDFWQDWMVRVNRLRTTKWYYYSYVRLSRFAHFLKPDSWLPPFHSTQNTMRGFIGA